MRSETSAASGAGWNRLRRALGYARPFRRPISYLFAVTILVAVANACEPLLIKYIFDRLEAERRFRPLLGGIAGLVGLGLFREVANALSNWLTWKTRIGLQHSLLEAMVSRLHRVPLSFHRTEGVGAIMTKLDRSIQGFLNAVSQILFTAFPAILYLALSIALMLQLNWKLALLVISFTPIPALVAALASPEQTRREKSLFDQYVRIYSRFNEVLSGILTVRSFSMEDAEKRRFLGDVEKANKIVIRGVGIDSGYGAVTNLVILLARIAAITMGVFLVVRGEVTIGTVLAFLGYVGSLFSPVQGLSSVYQTIQRASVALEEMFAILDLRENFGDRPDARPINAIRGDVAFENVHFSYEPSNRPILAGISLGVRAGETVAIVGPSGSGKTTMMALLMRFYEPSEGIIRLDGTDLRDLKQSSLRRAIGVVLQDPLLFNDTVRNNIAYGRPEATMSEVIDAANAANAHDFISRLPEGYETMLGERGSRLSVGERQRITIARALAKNPPIIVLDEATSSLDAESEAMVQEALDRLMKGRTTFVIAHRLSTVVNANRIIVLKQGRIVESGTHGTLMRLDGYYASLVKRQTLGLIRNEGEPAFAA